MIINGSSLLKLSPIEGMLDRTEYSGGTSYGLSEVGYDIRCAEDIVLDKDTNFVLASSIEKFNMPDVLLGRVCDKSTWARRGVSVFNTLIKPGWSGYLTIEIVYQDHRGGPIHIPRGSGIAQVIFEEISDRAVYEGQYQDQPRGPVSARAYKSEGKQPQGDALQMLRTALSVDNGQGMPEWGRRRQ